MAVFNGVNHSNWYQWCRNKRDFHVYCNHSESIRHRVQTFACPMLIGETLLLLMTMKSIAVNDRRLCVSLYHNHTTSQLLHWTIRMRDSVEQTNGMPHGVSLYEQSRRDDQFLFLFGCFD